MSAEEIEDAVDEDVDPDGGVALDDEDMPDDELDEDLELDEDVALDSDDEDDEDDEPSGKSAAADRSGDEDDDELDPEDVEADLDTILKDRLASNDDEEEANQDEEGGQVKSTPQAARQANEFHCPSCFLLVDIEVAQNTSECPHCGAPIDYVPA
jgi:hypothetical protein